MLQCIEKSGGNVHTKTLPFRDLQTSAALAACAGTKLHVKNLFFTLETCFLKKIIKLKYIISHYLSCFNDKGCKENKIS